MQRRHFTEAHLNAAARLKKLWEVKRMELGLTQEDISHLCGWHGQSAFGQYLHARVPLNIEAVLRLARVLRVHPVEIMPEIAELLPDCRQPDDSPTPSEKTSGPAPEIILFQDFRMVPQGIRDLASDRALTETLAITPDEWRRLAAVSQALPPTVDKAGYVALLYTLRAIAPEVDRRALGT